MLIGVVSDSHDNLTAIAAAVKVLSGHGAERLLHAGDIVAPFAAKAWRLFPGPITAVYGNNDGEKPGLAKVLDDIHPAPYALRLAGRHIVLTHDVGRLAGMDLSEVDLVVHGHSHQPETRREGRTVWINPGETGGWLTGRRTCALVDLDRLDVEMIEL
jgi:putative phosphoesterase